MDVELLLFALALKADTEKALKNKRASLISSVITNFS